MHAQVRSALTSLTRLGSGPLLEIVLAVSLQCAQPAHLPEPLQETLLLSLRMRSQNFLGQAQLLQRPLFLAEATGCAIQGLGPAGYIFHCLCKKKQALISMRLSVQPTGQTPHTQVAHAARSRGPHSPLQPSKADSSKQRPDDPLGQASGL